MGLPDLAKACPTWRQGSVLHDRHLKALAHSVDCRKQAGIVISHSCDLAHHDQTGEPHAEVLIGEYVPNLDGNFTHGKHPRKLHMQLHGPGQELRTLEFAPWRRVMADRDKLLADLPDHGRYLLRDDITTLAAWMARSYQRAAFPNDFNETVRTLGKKPNRIHARISPSVSGLYARIYPDRDLEVGEQYSLDLVALVPVDKQADLENVRKDMEKLAKLFMAAGVDADAAAMLESSMSFSEARTLRRFPLEYLSLRHEPHDPMPAECSCA